MGGGAERDSGCSSRFWRGWGAPLVEGLSVFDLLDRRDCVGDDGGLVVVNSRSGADTWQIVAEQMMRSESRTGNAECVK